MAKTEPVVYVDLDGCDWYAICYEHGVVALKESQDDADLVAAYHIAREHAGLVLPVVKDLA